MKLYHLTHQANLPSIERSGLSSDLAGRRIYLASDPGHAAAYEAKYPGQPVALLEVDSRFLDEELMGPDDVDLEDLLAQNDDPRHWSEVGWKESLKVSGQAAYAGIIPPRAIKVIRRWKAS